jgi:hypothetical protein
MSRDRLRRKSTKSQHAHANAMTGDSHNLKSLGVVETRVSLSVYYRILSLPKQHPALIPRTSFVPPRTPSFIFADLARARLRLPRASRLALLSLSCPIHVYWSSLVRFPCYFHLSNISPSLYSRRRASRGTKSLITYFHAYI